MYNTTQYVARTVTEMLPSSAYPRHQSIGHIQLRFFYSLTSFYQRQHLTRTNLLGNQKLILHYMVTCIQNKAGERGLAFVCTSVNQIIYTFHVISNTMVLQVQLVSTNIKPFAPHPFNPYHYRKLSSAYLGSGASCANIQSGWPDRLHCIACCFAAIDLNVTIPVPEKNSDTSPKNLRRTLLGMNRV